MTAGRIPSIEGGIQPTLLSTTGDIMYASSASNPARLAIGSSAQVLTVASGVPSWATPSSGSMTLLSTTSLTGASVTLSSISQSHKNLYFVFVNPKTANNGIPFNIRFNADATANRHAQTDSWVSSASYSSTSAWLNQGNFGNVTDSGLLAGWIYDYTNATTWKFGNTFGVGTDSTAGTAARFAFNMMAYNQTGAITSLLFLPNSGNWTSGTLLLYGVS